jgi:hypothetical protein
VSAEYSASDPGAGKTLVLGTPLQTLVLEKPQPLLL